MNDKDKEPALFGCTAGTLARLEHGFDVENGWADREELNK